MLVALSTSAPASACVTGLGTWLADDAAALADRACGVALEQGRVGEDFRFQDPATRTAGSVTAGEAFRDSTGVFCRRLTASLVAPSSGRVERRRWSGVACRRGPGDWVWSDVIVQESQRHAPSSDPPSAETSTPRRD